MKDKNQDPLGHGKHKALNRFARRSHLSKMHPVTVAAQTVSRAQMAQSVIEGSTSFKAWDPYHRVPATLEQRLHSLFSE